MTFLKRTGCLLLALLLFAAPLLELPVLAVNNTLGFTEGVGCSDVPMYSFDSAVLGAELVSGAVPPGMSWAINGQALTISGTPSASGTFGMEFTVSTGTESVIPLSITVTVESAPAPPHVHLFGSEWQTDTFSHWHVCACGERSDLNPHSVQNWITIRPSTATEQGERQGQCSVCGYTVVEALPLHTHSFSPVWQSNMTSHWHICDCGEQSDLGSHTVGSWTVIKAPTATELGQRQGSCTVCGYVVTEALPLHNHVFAGNWQYDSINHWQVCTCGEKGNVSPHKGTDWVVTRESTATMQGERQGRCSVCGATVTEALPLHNHTFTGDWKHDSNGHWQLCACGEKGAVHPHQGTDWKITRESTATVPGERKGKCSVCGATVTEALPLHTHTFAGEWRHNTTMHWQLCECGEKGNKGEHSVQSWTVTRKSTATEPGERQGKCSVCGYTVSQPLELHVHSCPPEWKNDKTSHWHFCECGEKVDLADHVIAEWVEVKTPTTKTEGERQGKCTVCGYTVIEILPVHTHSFDKKVWDSDNEKHWNRCECGEKMNLAPHDVKEADWVTLKAATAELEGERRGKCSVCGALVTEAIPKLLPPTVTKQPTRETLEVGGRAMFVAKADNVESYSWRFVSADNSKTVEYSSAANYFTGLTVIGGNTDTMTISTVPLSLDGWKAVCRFRNKNGDSFSEGALITVKKALSQLPIITLQPKSVTAVSGESVTLSVRALSPDGGDLVYQWYRSPDGTTGSSLPVSGATESTFTPEERIGETFYCVSIRSENAVAQSDTLFSELVSVTFTEKPEPEPEHIHEFGDEWHHDDETHYHLCECGERGSSGAHVFEWTEVKKAGKKSPGLRTGKCVICAYEVREEIPASRTGRHGLLIFILTLLALLLLAAAALLILKQKGLLTVEGDEDDGDGGDPDPDDDFDPDDPDGDAPFPGVLGAGATLSAIFAAEAAGDGFEDTPDKNAETDEEETAEAPGNAEPAPEEAPDPPETAVEKAPEAGAADMENAGLSAAVPGAAAAAAGLSGRAAKTSEAPETTAETAPEALEPAPEEAPEETVPEATAAGENESPLTAAVLGAAAAAAGASVLSGDDGNAKERKPDEPTPKTAPTQTGKKKKPSARKADDLSAELNEVLLFAEDTAQAVGSTGKNDARSEDYSALLDEMISASESSSRKSSTPAPGLAETSGGSYASPTGNIMSFSSSDPSAGGKPGSER